MTTRYVVGLLLSALSALSALMLPAMCAAQPTCVAPTLSDQQVKDIVNGERKTRKDLPSAFAESRTTVRRLGCHYLLTERGIPEGPERANFFTLNQYGVIVDAEPGSLQCPEKVFSESELADIVKKERDRRPDIPRPLGGSTRVSRERCMYLYYEYAVPERRGDYLVFTIDPLGELFEFSRSKPY